MRVFLRRDLEHTEQMLASAEDPAMKEDLTRRRTEILERRERLANEGSTIIGLELRGPANALERFRDERPYVLFLEIREPPPRESTPAD